MALRLIFYSLIFFNTKAFAFDLKQFLIFQHSNYCHNYIEYFENHYNIPTNLLKSISLIETGRWHKDSKTFFAWPWSIHQGGKAFYLNNKQEAIAKVTELLKNGETNIDVGCMQINLHHHPEAFENLNKAFDPFDNVAYAANFLIKNFSQLKSWHQAVAKYHSYNEIGLTYANKVDHIWQKLNNKQLNTKLCLSTNGNISSCYPSTSSINNNINVKANNQSNNLIANQTNIKKDLKRLKSSMIIYAREEFGNL